LAFDQCRKGTLMGLMGGISAASEWLLALRYLVRLASGGTSTVLSRSLISKRPF